MIHAYAKIIHLKCAIDKLANGTLLGVVVAGYNEFQMTRTEIPHFTTRNKSPLGRSNLCMFVGCNC